MVGGVADGGGPFGAIGHRPVPGGGEEALEAGGIVAAAGLLYFAAVFLQFLERMHGPSFRVAWNDLTAQNIVTQELAYNRFRGKELKDLR